MKTQFGQSWFRAIWQNARGHYQAHHRKFDPDD